MEDENNLFNVLTARGLKYDAPIEHCGSLRAHPRTSGKKTGKQSIVEDV